jgi:hypothetical protein
METNITSDVPDRFLTKFEEESLKDWYENNKDEYEISKDFKEVILLSRKNLIDCTESWSFLLHNAKKGFRSNLPYLWEKTPNYDEQLDFIKKCDEELKYISEKINTPIKFYEDLYDLNDVNRLRKGDRDNTEKNKLL